jgi:hypothetical protein
MQKKPTKTSAAELLNAQQLSRAAATKLLLCGFLGRLISNASRGNRLWHQGLWLHPIASEG